MNGIFIAKFILTKYKLNDKLYVNKKDGFISKIKKFLIEYRTPKERKVKENDNRFISNFFSTLFVFN